MKREDSLPEATIPKDLEQLALELAELDPKPVTHFTPDNLSEIRSRYLQGETEVLGALTYSQLDELPWHTVLSYRNGSQTITDFIEVNKRDPELMTLLFLGKIDPTQPNHVRGALDARTRY